MKPEPTGQAPRIEVDAVADAAPDLSKLLVYYDNDHMLPRSITVRDQDGTEIRGPKRLVIEITPNSLPRVLELET